jgi:hypothetical protein
MVTFFTLLDEDEEDGTKSKSKSNSGRRRKQKKNERGGKESRKEGIFIF